MLKNDLKNSELIPAITQPKIFQLNQLWWLALLIIVIFFHSNHSLNSDEGVILEGAWNLSNGKLLYYDFFEFIPPASFYLINWLWQLVGVSFFSAKTLALFFVFLSAIFIFKISRLIAANPYNYLPPFIFIISTLGWPIINHNVFNLFFIILATYYFLKTINNQPKKAGLIIICGLLTGVSILFLQQRGLALLLTIFTYLIFLTIVEKKLVWLKISLFYLISAGLPLVLLLIFWPANLLYQNLIIFPLFNYLPVNQFPFHLFFFFLLIFILYVVLLKRYWLNKKLTFLLFLEFCLLVTALIRADYFHLTLIVFPLYCLTPIILNSNNTNKISAKLPYLIVLSYLIFITSPSLITLYYFPPFSPIKQLPVISYIKNNCNDSPYLYAGPFIPGLYFETKKLNATAYPILITNHQTNEQFKQAEQQLEKNQPACAILNYQIVKKFNYNTDNPVDNFIFDNYQLVRQFDNNLVYVLK